jgi:hypothetical protein
MFIHSKPHTREKFGWRINFHKMADMRVNEEQIANITG